jgi:hypothetical protein
MDCSGNVPAALTNHDLIRVAIGFTKRDENT